MAGRWIIDVARAEIAGRTIFVAAVLDLETREIIAIDTGTFAGSALGGAFGGAVFARGAPKMVVLDQGEDSDVVAREAAKLGAEVRYTQPGEMA